jgi:hypothetical protein
MSVSRVKSNSRREERLSVPKLPVVQASPRMLISWEYLEGKREARKEGRKESRKVDSGWNKLKLFLLEEEDRRYLKEHDKAEGRGSLLASPENKFKYSIAEGLEQPVRLLIQKNNR